MQVLNAIPDVDSEKVLNSKINKKVGSTSLSNENKEMLKQFLYQHREVFKEPTTLGHE